MALSDRITHNLSASDISNRGTPYEITIRVEEGKSDDGKIYFYNFQLNFSIEKSTNIAEFVFAISGSSGDNYQSFSGILTLIFENTSNSNPNQLLFHKTAESIDLDGEIKESNGYNDETITRINWILLGTGVDEILVFGPLQIYFLYILLISLILFVIWYFLKRNKRKSTYQLD